MSRENFPVALRVLPVGVRTDLRALYRFARWVDDVGDELPGDRVAALEEVRRDLRRLYDDGTARIPEVAGLATTVLRRRLPLQPFDDLVEANLVDQHRTRYDSFDDLLDYCRLSANPVGRLVLAVFDQATPDLLPLSDSVCTGLQLVEHWQDLREDYVNGRVYLPQEDLCRFGVAEAELGGRRADRPLRDLVRFETGRALDLLAAGDRLVAALRGWGRLAVAGYVAGGRAAARILERQDYDPLGEVAKPSVGSLLAAAVPRGARGPAWAR